MNLPTSGTTRRQWVKQFMLCSAAALVAPRWTSAVLANVTPSAPGKGVLRIKPSSFPALANPGGSIQLTFIQGIEPLTLNRVTSDRFVTLDSICTHAGCTVGRFIVANNHMRCPCHGSRYDIEGRVFRDVNGNSTQPAPDDLARYETAYDAASDTISIAIPSLALQMDSISVQQRTENGELRLKLVFPVTFGAVYQISYSPGLSSPPATIPFATTADGPANQTTIGPSVSGMFTAYVDAAGSRGFFSVSVMLTPLT